MQYKFRFNLAKLLCLISVGLVLTVGLSLQLPLETLIVRTLIGASVFTIIGFILGMIIDNKNKKSVVNKKKKKLQNQIKKDLEETENGETPAFEEMDVDQLTKIVHNSMAKDNE